MNTIFSVNVYKEKLDIKNKPLINYLLKLKKDSKGRKISNPTGWQSFPIDVNQDIFLHLNKEIQKKFVKYMESIPLNNSFQISSVWGNINGYKDYVFIIQQSKVLIIYGDIVLKNLLHKIAFFGK